MLVRGRRRVLHGEGQGPQPRAGLQPRKRRGDAAQGRDGMGEPHPSRAGRQPLLPVRAAGARDARRRRPPAVHRAAAAPARRRRRARAADGVHSGRGALSPDARDRPLGDQHRVRDARAAVRARAATRRPIGVCAINVSGASIGDDDFLDFVQRAVRRARASRIRSVCFEITETTAVASLSKATQFMTGAARRSAAGSRSTISASAFRRSRISSTCPSITSRSTAASSRTCSSDPVNHAMVEAIHRIGHIMGKKTIAESVENRDTLKALRAIGVDYAQGFAIASPAPFGRLQALPKWKSARPRAVFERRGSRRRARSAARPTRHFRRLALSSCMPEVRKGQAPPPLDRDAFHEQASSSRSSIPRSASRKTRLRGSRRSRGTRTRRAGRRRWPTLRAPDLSIRTTSCRMNGARRAIACKPRRRASAMRRHRRVCW